MCKTILQITDLIYLYNILTHISIVFINIFGLFNKKLKQGIDGRQLTFQKLKSNLQKKKKTIWLHCASLGEYEQGVPVLEKLKNKFQDHQVVISFFSPSGYEIKKDTKLADVVVYLPWDTHKNAKTFLNIVSPDIIVFVKYDLWPNFLLEIKNRNLNAILISANFRKNQAYFKWYGGFMKSSLFAFKHIFLQNKNSEKLLKSINYHSTTVTGDTRFDRVLSQLDIDNTLDFISKFKGDDLCFVCGSNWPDDDKLILPFINGTKHKNLKFIIAPHNIKKNYISEIEKQLKVPFIKYSEMDTSKLDSAKVFIIDTIGLLSKIYSYADISYVGGAAGKTGLHNILEPAVFGTPIIIGKNYSKFPEAIELVKRKGVISITDNKTFDNVANDLIKDSAKRLELGKINKDYVEESKDATSKIMKYFES